MRAISTAASAIRHSLVAITEALLVAAIIAAVLLAFAPVYRPADYLAGTDTADAARSRAWLSLSEDARVAPSAGSEYTVVGGDFVAGIGVVVNLAEPGCCRFFTVWPDADGDIAFSALAPSPGTYEVRAYQRLHPNKLTLMASLTFTVGE